jgi:GT2 family glycosyltransferase
MDTITVYILCRNRVDYLAEAIDSIINQSIISHRVNVVVSDNSTTNDVYHMVTDRYKDKVSYVKKSGLLRSYEHIQDIIREAKGEYTVIFHDDDIARPDFINIAIERLEKNQQLGAVAPNSISFGSGRNFFTMSRVSLFSKLINNDRSLYTDNYLIQGSVPAFCGYVYRTSILKKVKVENLTGIYFDSVLIGEIIKNSLGVLWLPNILILSRVHGNNEGLIDNLKERYKLVEFLQNSYGVEIPDFYYDYYIGIAKLRLNTKNNRMAGLIALFLIKFSFLISYKVVKIYFGRIVSRLFFIIFPSNV